MQSHHTEAVDWAGQSTEVWSQKRGNLKGYEMPMGGRTDEGLSEGVRHGAPRTLVSASFTPVISSSRDRHVVQKGCVERNLYSAAAASSGKGTR